MNKRAMASYDTVPQPAAAATQASWDIRAHQLSIMDKLAVAAEKRLLAVLQLESLRDEWERLARRTDKTISDVDAKLNSNDEGAF
jgi:hypothetical protein